MIICTKAQKTELSRATSENMPERSFPSDKSVASDDAQRSSSRRKIRNGHNCWPFANLKSKAKSKSQRDLKDHDEARFHTKCNDITRSPSTYGETLFNESSKRPPNVNSNQVAIPKNDESWPGFSLSASTHTTVQSSRGNDVLNTPNSSSTVTKTCENSQKDSLLLTANISNPPLPNRSPCIHTDAEGTQDGSYPGRYSELAAAVDHCDRRLERLYGRLIWLRNSAELPIKFSEDDLIPQNQTFRAPACKNEPSVYSSMKATEMKISSLSERLNELKNQIESFTYLSWIGLSDEPQTSKVVFPGKSCPAPNPQIHLVRRPDSQFRTIAEEYRRLCQTVLPEKTRFSLRETTFNNWPWSDAWLIRFVRQMFFDLSLVEHFHICTERLDIWLCDVYRRYNRVPFHNYKHAFMVTQMAYAIMWSTNLHLVLPKEEQLILLLSAVCHDLDHPGFNNAYQINAGTELAIRYNDQSPLENHHAAVAFDILSRSEANLLNHLDNDTFRRIREGIIRCILATDMSRHNDILNQFRETLLNDLEVVQSIDSTTKRPLWSRDKTKLDLVMMMLIKLCDISNEARPLAVSDPWINRLLAEFFNQSDYEKVVGLPVAPFMDRDDVTKASSQCGFIRFVILPLYEAAARLIPELEDVIVKPVIFQLDYYTEMQKVTEEGDAADGDPELTDEPVEK